MGWEDYHLWAFESGRRRFGLPDPDGMYEMRRVEDARRVTIGELLARKGARLRYNKVHAALPAPRGLH